MERIAMVDGLTLAAVLSRVSDGRWVILTRDGVDLVALARPADLSDAAMALWAEELERSGLSMWLAEWGASLDATWHSQGRPTPPTPPTPPVES